MLFPRLRNRRILVEETSFWMSWGMTRMLSFHSWRLTSASSEDSQCCNHGCRVKVHTDIGAATLKDESAINPQDSLQILLCPEAGRTHGLDQVGSCKQCNVNLLFLAGRCRDSAHDVVQLMVEVIQDFDCGHVLFVEGLPRINAYPGGALPHGDPCHVDAVVCGGQASLLVSIAHRAEEAANDLIVRLKFAEVGRLFEHAEVKVGGR